MAFQADDTRELTFRAVDTRESTAQVDGFGVSAFHACGSGVRFRRAVSGVQLPSIGFRAEDMRVSTAQAVNSPERSIRRVDSRVSSAQNANSRTTINPDD